MRDNRLIVVGVAVLLLIGGAAIVLGGGIGSEKSPEIASAPTGTDGLLTAEVTSTAAPADISPGEVQGEAGTVEILPTPRTELEASDPAEVDLASGSPQLVEAFAYW